MDTPQKTTSNRLRDAGYQTNAMKLKGIYRFFSWCAGARLFLLEKCPTDYNKFFGIGILVAFTGIMASISGTFAILSIFELNAISLTMGAFWGVFVFFLDWYILASLKKNKNNIGMEALSALPRLAISVLLAVVIAVPLELRLFEQEILQQLDVLKTHKSSNYQEMVHDGYGQIEKLQKETKP
ncbi:MAG: DUF4407 domain-containing protein [Bacteroidales bacterium]|nr:DUF4407 domain-containing protein [Bacteroidales bacterium]